MAVQSNTNFHVAIVGAGIAGLALAMALHKKGVPFTVYEEAKEYSVVGAGIGFAPNGMRTMDLIEPGFRPLYEKVCVGNKTDDAQWVFFEGMLLEPGLGANQPWSGNLKSAWGHQDYTRKSAHRKELLDIMTSFIPIESVKFNKKLTAIKEHPDNIVLEFEDGEIATTSVLAGADGISSTVRRYILEPTHPQEAVPVYAGAYCYRAVIPMNEAYEILGEYTDVAKLYFGKNQAAVTYRITGGNEFNFLLCKATPGIAWPWPGRVTMKITHEEMMSDFQGEDVDPRFRALLSKAKPVKWGFFHHARTSTYYKDRICLLGDSAHASMPWQAAGAAQGIEDALVLSNILEELFRNSTNNTDLSRQIAAGYKSYDSIRRPRAQKQLEMAYEIGEMLYFQKPETGYSMEKILSRLQNDRFNWLWFHDLEADVERAVSTMKKELQQTLASGNHSGSPIPTKL